MALTLSIASYDGQPFNHVPPYTLKKDRATIGRHSQSDWALPDTESYISGQHAIITQNLSHIEITDTSTNGVFINSSETALGYGNSVPLCHGDKIKIGMYDITASINDSTDTGPIIADDLLADLGNNPINQLLDNSMAFAAWDDSPSKKYSQENHNRENTLSSCPEAIFGEALCPAPITLDKADKQPSPLSKSNHAPFPTNWQELDGDTADIEPALQPKIAGERNGNEVKPDNSVASASQPPKITNQSELVSAFLKGLGLEESHATCRFDADTFYTIGKILKTSIQGTRAILMARAQLKNEMRLDVTTIHPIENNPIKLSFSTEEAIERLFASKNKGYMDPLVAIEEGFDDINSHQIAMLSGMQTAFQSAFLRFDPMALQNRLQEQNPISSKIPIQKQAKLWQSFEKLYTEIESEAKDDFNKLFGQEFSKAYEEQDKKLKQDKAKNSL